ncbi:MAG: hypothetical protein AMXMBFR84_00940 [Candidatus Hydrogenedentota bacterium]
MWNFSLVLISVLAASGEVAFLAGTEQEDRCVHVLSVETGEVTRVGLGERDGAPVWSPEGDQIAFSAQYPDGLGIYVIHYPGGTPQLVPAIGTWNQYPRWSPDGSKLAFQVGGLLEASIEVFDVTKNASVRYGGEAKGLMRPVWEANDRLITVGIRGLPDELTSGLTLVTENNTEKTNRSSDAYTVWAVEPSAPLEAVAFESNDGGDREIIVYTARSGAVDVSNHAAADLNPVWSPDGQWIAFESFRGGTRGLYQVKPAQLLVKTIAADPGYNNWSPSWSPDMTQVAFITDRSGSPKLAIVDLASGETRLFDAIPGDHAAPAWRPKGK